jgi:hypothetical protein
MFLLEKLSGFLTTSLLQGMSANKPKSFRRSISKKMSEAPRLQGGAGHVPVKARMKAELNGQAEGKLTTYAGKGKG